MKKLNAYEKIQLGIKENNKSLMKHIRELNRAGNGYRPVMIGRAWGNAMERMIVAGKISYRHSKKDYFRNGYWIIKNGKFIG